MEGGREGGGKSFTVTVVGCVPNYTRGVHSEFFRVTVTAPSPSPPLLPPLGHSWNKKFNLFVESGGRVT